MARLSSILPGLQSALFFFLALPFHLKAVPVITFIKNVCRPWPPHFPFPALGARRLQDRSYRLGPYNCFGFHG